MKAKLLHIFLLNALAGCIGVDYLDDPIVGARIEVTQKQMAFMPGQTAAFMAVYYDEYGVEQPVALMWDSTDPLVASVDPAGLVMANMKGQAFIQVSYMDVSSEQIQVNVVTDPDDIATIEITADQSLVNVSDVIQFSAVVKNFEGEILDEPVTWMSDAPGIVSIDVSTGEATALADGLAKIYAVADGVESIRWDVVVGTTRTGTFVSSGGYTTKGSATLFMENGKLILELSDDFETSFALGTYVYLANQTGGSAVLSNGVEIQQITSNGAHRYVISDVAPDVALYDYRYIIMLCKPAAVTFGFADLNQ